MQIANKYINKHSLSLTIRDSSQSYRETLSHLVLLLANRPKPKLEKLVEREEFLCIVIGNRNYCSHYGVPQILKLEPPYIIWSNQTTLGRSSRKWSQQEASVKWICCESRQLAVRSWWQQTVDPGTVQFPGSGQQEQPVLGRDCKRPRWQVSEGVWSPGRQGWRTRLCGMYPCGGGERARERERDR